MTKRIVNRETLREEAREQAEKDSGDTCLELETYAEEFGLDYGITFARNCKGLREDHVSASLDGILRLDVDGPASIVIPILRTALGMFDDS